MFKIIFRIGVLTVRIDANKFDAIRGKFFRRSIFINIATNNTGEYAINSIKYIRNICGVNGGGELGSTENQGIGKTSLA